MRDSKKVDLKGDNKKDKVDSVPLSQNEINEYINHDITITGHPDTISTTSSSEASENPVSGTNVAGSLYVDKEKISTAIEQYKMKLDTVNEQSELMSIDLQTLTNQRKIAFETVSQIIRKQDEGMSTIIKNIG